ncbi:type II toxin-antitoxin system RelE/ParE family toxin [Desulfoferrobacter suflitae]|uniref:type II toxin-antitoxin system RelE/ParE family toxin n=1 Tax=Desulfoferrobacter suflitae TaxID=2865782 RepID=UPI00338E3E27
MVRFRHKELEQLFTRGHTSGVSAQHVRNPQQILAFLNASQEPADMNLPGFRLHPLKGERKGQWAVSVTGNLRIMFEFDGANTTNVDLVDYH